MSTTLKQGIEALKTRIAGAYAEVSAKGGTLPATQDSANLPAAIASIPSGVSLDNFQYLDENGENIALNVFTNLGQWRSHIRTIHDYAMTSAFYAIGSRNLYIFNLSNSNVIEVIYEKLTTVPVSFIYMCPNLKKVTFEKCTNILNNTSAIENCNSLEEIIAPAATFLGNANLCLYNVPQLKRIYCPNITGAGTWNSSVMSGVPRLIDLEFGAKITGNWNLQYFTPTTALSTSDSSLVTDQEDEFGNPITNNREQFLYNWRRHIAANLPTVSGKVITLSADVKAAIQGSQVTSDAFTNKGWTIA